MDGEEQDGVVWYSTKMDLQILVCKVIYMVIFLNIGYSHLHNEYLIPYTIIVAYCLWPMFTKLQCVQINLTQWVP